MGGPRSPLALALAILLLAPMAPAAPEPDVQLLDGLDAQILFTPNDPRYGTQYNLPQVRAPDAWETTLGDNGASVCILDTGVRMTHEDLLARYQGGYDVVNDDNDPSDDQGHGTHMAGVAAATIHNGVGIAGIGNVGVYAVKVLGSTGSGTFADVAEGISWCTDNTGPRTVLVIGFGAANGHANVDQSIEAAIDAGKLVVAGSGGSGTSVAWPANLANVIGVGCTSSGENACSFGGKGPELDIVAPGANILSLGTTNDSAYRTSSGTSWSAATIGGALALYWSHAPNMSATQLRARLLATTQDLGAQGHDNTYGCGELDLHDLFAGPPTTPACAAATIGPPQTFTATTGQGAGEIALSWNPPAYDSGSPTTHYTIHRALTCSGPFNLIAQIDAPTTTHLDTGLGNGATRCYHATAHHALGASPPSTTASATTLLPPGQPTQPHAAPLAPGTIHITWNAPTTGGRIDGYILERAALHNTWNEIARPTTTAWTNDGLDTLDLYAYRVRAHNPAGTSGASGTTCSAAAGADVDDDVDCAIWRALHG